MLSLDALAARWPDADRRRLARPRRPRGRARASPPTSAPPSRSSRRRSSTSARLKRPRCRVFDKTFAVTVALNALTFAVAGVALFTSLLDPRRRPPRPARAALGARRHPPPPRPPRARPRRRPRGPDRPRRPAPRPRARLGAHRGRQRPRLRLAAPGRPLPRPDGPPSSSSPSPSPPSPRSGPPSASAARRPSTCCGASAMSADRIRRGTLCRFSTVLLALLPASPPPRATPASTPTAAGFAPVTAPADLVIPARPRAPPRLPHRVVVRDRQPHRPRRRRLRRPVDAVPPGDRPRTRGPRLGERPRSGWATPPSPPPPTHRFAETFARGGIGQAGRRASPFHAWIDAWDLAATARPRRRRRPRPPSPHRRAATASPTTSRSPPTAPVPQGDAGYSVKSTRGQASYYYSQPSYTVTGTLTLDGERDPRHRPGLARPRMVVASRSPPARRAGTGSPSTSTPARR